MGREVGRGCKAACAGALVFVSTLAAAEPFLPGPSPQAEPVAFEVTAPTECADASAFFRSVRARTGRVRESEGGPGERRFRVNLVPFARGFEGTLSVVTEGREGAPRRIEAPTCHEAVDALALVAALAIDPEASLTTEPPPAEPPSAPFAGPEAVDERPVLSPSARTPKANTEKRAPVMPRALAAPPSEGRSPFRASLGTSFALGADADLSRGVFFPTAALALELAVARRAPLARRFRLGVRGSLPTSVDSESGSADFTIVSARAEGCPLVLGRPGSLELLPCALLDGGFLRARGDTGSGEVSRTRPYFGAGVLARARGHVRMAFLELDLGVSRPLVRDTFSFRPAETIYEAPAVFVFAALGLSIKTGAWSH